MSDTDTPADPKAQLAQVRSRLAELAAARQARAEDPVLALAKAQSELADAEAIDAAEKAHGPLGTHIKAYPTPNGVVIVKRANHLIFRRFSDAGELTTARCEELIFPSLVHPSRDEFEARAEAFPGIIVPLASLISELAGVRAKADAGK